MKAVGGPSGWCDFSSRAELLAGPISKSNMFWHLRRTRAEAYLQGERCNDGTCCGPRIRRWCYLGTTGVSTPWPRRERDKIEDMPLYRRALCLLKWGENENGWLRSSFSSYYRSNFIVASWQSLRELECRKEVFQRQRVARSIVTLYLVE